LRASRAEDLAEARRHLSEQAELIVEQKQRLDYGISILKDAQARFANGDYTARAKLQNNELASLAVSFNLMAERLNRITQFAQEYSRIERALQQLIDMQNTLLDGGSLKPLAPTRTLADHIYPIFQQYYRISQLVARSGPASDKIRKEFTQQQHMLTQLASVLAQTHALLQLLPDSTKNVQESSLQLVEKAQELCNQLNEQGKEGLQETRQLDQELKGYSTKHRSVKKPNT
jgi:methyl-accepting chemotaxis protein